jgi:hypothetical protein
MGKGQRKPQKMCGVFALHKKKAIIFGFMGMTVAEIREMQPQKLSELELENPVLAITKFYESFELSDVRRELAEALELVVKKRFGAREYSREEDDLRFFYERMERVMESAWMMRE